MSATLLRFTETKVSGPEATHFGITDERGRAIGYSVSIFSRTYEAQPADSGWGNVPQGIHQEGSTIYRAQTWTTRNGQPFGAVQPSIFGTTLEEVQAAVGQRRAGARARYAKKASR